MIKGSLESTYSELLSAPRPAEIHQLPGQVRHAFGAEGCLIVLRVVPVAVARCNRRQAVLLTRADVAQPVAHHHGAFGAQVVQQRAEIFALRAPRHGCRRADKHVRQPEHLQAQRDIVMLAVADDA